MGSRIERLRPVLFLLLALLAGCAVPPAGEERPAEPEPLPKDAVVISGVGDRYEIIGGESTVRILVFREGPLSAAGHDHVLESRDPEGEFELGPSVVGGRFSLRVPVGSLVVDDPGLRLELGGSLADPVPRSAAQSTRQRLLSDAVLDVLNHPYLNARGEVVRLQQGQPVVEVELRVRGRRHRVEVPLELSRQAGKEVRVQGRFWVRQSAFGIEPFSTLGGGLRVADELEVRLSLLGRVTGTLRP